MKYIVETIETVTRTVIHTVESDSEDAARDQVMSGDSLTSEIKPLSEEIVDVDCWDIHLAEPATVMFDLAVEIEAPAGGLDAIPLAALVAAARARLDRIEESGDREAFGEC